MTSQQIAEAFSRLIDRYPKFEDLIHNQVVDQKLCEATVIHIGGIQAQVDYLLSENTPDELFSLLNVKPEDLR